MRSSNFEYLKDEPQLVCYPRSGTCSLKEQCLLRSSNFEYLKDEPQLVCYPRSGTCSLRNSVCCVLIIFPIVRLSQPTYVRGTSQLRFSQLLVHQVTSEDAVGMCVFWKPSLPPYWADYGCRRVPEESNNEITTCACNHLTIFAALFDPYGAPVSNRHRPLVVMDRFGSGG